MDGERVDILAQHSERKAMSGYIVSVPGKEFDVSCKIGAVADEDIVIRAWVDGAE